MQIIILLRIPGTLVLWLLVAGSRLSAQPVTIDFQGLAPMAAVPGSPVPLASQLSDQFLSSHGLLFQSESVSPYVALVDLGGGGVGIGSVDDNHNLSYETGFRINFFLPGQPSVSAATDFASIHPAANTVIGIAYAMSAFDVEGTLLSGDFNITTQGSPLNIGFPGAEIHSLQLFGRIAFDDVTFNTPLVAVPEPSLFALTLLIGMVAFIYSIGRSKLCAATKSRGVGTAD